MVASSGKYFSAPVLDGGAKIECLTDCHIDEVFCVNSMLLRLIGIVNPSQYPQRLDPLLEKLRIKLL